MMCIFVIGKGLLAISKLSQQWSATRHCPRNQLQHNTPALTPHIPSHIQRRALNTRYNFNHCVHSHEEAVARHWRADDRRIKKADCRHETLHGNPTHTPHTQTLTATVD
jgi:hypothetical protein